VAVGSNTTQGLFTKWSTDYNLTNPTHKLYSWDATGTSPIQTKNNANCTGITRPNGSGSGIAALNNNTKTTDGNYCIDIARSSRQITSADGVVSSVLLAQDAITWSATSGGNAVATLTAAQLNAIYSCTDTKWNQVGGTSSATIVPVLPQSGSGTRSTFLSDIGSPTLGSCVVNKDGTQAIEENEGTNAVFTGTNAPNVLVPFSIGSYISQKYIGSSPNNTGSLALEKINNIAPTTGSGTSTKINTLFPSTFFRGLYAVIRGTSVPTYEQALLGKGDKSGWVCGASGTSTTAATDIANLGFLTTTTCGSITVP
jgi:ABC-type phosphate transport system substrate-binding protein